MSLEGLGRVKTSWGEAGFGDPDHGLRVPVEALLYSLQYVLALKGHTLYQPKS